MAKRKYILPIYCIDENFKIAIINLLVLNHLEEKVRSKKWRENNLDKVKADKKIYYANNAEKILASRKIYYETNKENKRDYDKAYRVDNKEKIKADKKIYREINLEKIEADSKIYREANAENRKDYDKAYRVDNPDKCRAHGRTRRARENNSEGQLLFGEELEILITQKYTCVYCNEDLNVTGHHLDHIIPISKNGSSWKDNHQGLCPSCNSKKHAKWPWEYESSIGYERDPEFWNNPRLYTSQEYLKLLEEEAELWMEF